MSQRSRLRLVVLQVLVLSLMLTLFGRLYYLQVIAGEQYQVAAAENRIRDVVTPANRGLILDAVGRPLVQNRTSIVVSVDRTRLGKQDDKGEAVLKRLSKALDMKYRDVFDSVQLCGTEDAKPAPVCWNGSPYQPIPVAKDVPQPVALSIMERSEDFPGVSAEVEAIRDFPSPEGANAAHLLGYLQPVREDELKAQKDRGDTVMQSTELIGRAGLEAQYDAQLRGEPGVRSLAVDKNGAVEGTVSVEPGKAGNYVVTSIDAKLQKVVEQELVEAVQRARSTRDIDATYGGGNYRGTSAAGVVLDVRTGQVLAMASYPTYDPKVWVGGVTTKELKALYAKDNGTPLLPRPWSGEFSPASTFKVVSTAAAVENGYPFNGYYECPSSFEVGTRTFQNYEGQAGASGTFAKLLEKSCDTAYYKIAFKMWLDDGGLDPKKKTDDFMLNMTERFGFGRDTGIDLPSEKDGSVIDRADKKAIYEEWKDTWCKIGRGDVPGQSPMQVAIAKENCTDGDQYRAGDAVNFAIGQGDMLVTPLQLANAYSAIGNGGKLMEPHVMKAIVAPDGAVVQRAEPKVIGELGISDSLRANLNAALKSVTTGGTAASAFSGFPLGRIPVAGKTGTGEAPNKQTTAWFASYAPADDPQYAVVVMVEEGGTGGGTAAPAVRDIYEAIFGVSGSSVDPAKSVLPDGRIPKKLPTINPDGTVDTLVATKSEGGKGKNRNKGKGDQATNRGSSSTDSGRRRARRRGAPRPPS